MKSIELSQNVSLSAIVAGCMRIAEAGLSPAEILRFTEECLEMGVDSFDHAPVYGGYTVEELFGNAVLRKNPALRAKMKLVSKTGIAIPGADGGNRHVYYTNTAEWILPEVDRSLQKLGTDYLDLLLVHRFDPLASPAALGELLDGLVKSGKTLSVGVSNYTPAAFDALQAHMKERLVTNQVEISAKTPDILFDGLGDDALRRALPLMAWSPLGGGSLFTGQDEQSLRLRSAAEALAKEHGIGVDTLLYAWVLRLPQSIMAVTGSMKPERIRAAVSALELTLSYDEWYTLLAASRGFDVP